MRKRLISMLSALILILGLLPGTAFAASTPEEALGEVDIYSGGYGQQVPIPNGDETEAGGEKALSLF